MISTEQLLKIKAIISDIDGVMTDCTVGYGSAEPIKFFNYRDGHWIKLAMRAGLLFGWLSGKSSQANRDRAKELGISFCYEGILDKLDGFTKLLAEYNLNPEECLYIGDDFVDMPVMRRAGVSVVVADGIPELDEVADMRTSACGGHGAVCEVIRIVLNAQGKLSQVTERYRK